MILIDIKKNSLKGGYFMELLHGVSEPHGYYGIVPGRNILKSGGIGVWKPEYVEDLIENLLRLAKRFGGQPFAYIADPTRMSPILSKDTSAGFVKLHVALENAGCKATAFLDANTAGMKLQSQKHQNLSEAEGMQVLHFKTNEEALDWLEKMGI